MSRICKITKIRHIIINLHSKRNKLWLINMYYNYSKIMYIYTRKYNVLCPSANFFQKNVKNPSAQHIFKNGGPKILKKIFFFGIWTQEIILFLFLQLTQIS